MSDIKIGITGAKGFIGSYLINNLLDPIIFVGDLLNLDDVHDFVSQCDRIYHLAGKNRDKGGKILKNNILSTSNLVFEACASENTPEVIFASSQQVTWNAKSEYGFAKGIEEEIIKKAPRWCIYRIPNVYGPGCKPFYNSVVATFCYQISKGEPVVINDSKVKREFIFIDDLIRDLLLPSFNIYIFPKGELLSIGEIYSLLTDNYGQHSNLTKCLSYYK